MKYNFKILLLLFLVTSCFNSKARKPISKSSNDFIEESIARNKKLYASEEKAIKQLIKNDSLHTYYSSPNGFWYYFINKVKTDTDKPKFGNEVTFDYEIKNLNGSLIYSKEELGLQNYLVDQQDLIQGLQEGIKILKEGEIVSFLFPSYKAFGYYGDKNRIDVNQPIIINVHLIKINKKTQKK